MSNLWQRYVQWFDARQPREKLVLAGCAGFAVFMLGWQQWAGPAFTEATKLTAQATRDRELAQALSAQLGALEQQAGSPNKAAQATLVELRRGYEAQEPRLQAMQKSLVTARNMPGFLENLLAGNKSLQLLSLETLPPEPLVATKAEDDKNRPAAPQARVFKHGVKLRLSGGYRELLAYLGELEQSPQRVLWGDMKLNVVSHPRVEMTLTVYTLSLDKTWMTL